MIRLAALVLLLALPATAAPAKSPSEKARTWFTDTKLLDQQGRSARFYTDVLKDRVVLVNFIFTHCSDACPLLTRKLLEVRTLLGPTFGSKVRFVSMSVDPARDDPPALREFAKKQGVPEQGWTFLTGPQESLDAVLQRLGQAVGEPTDHSTGLTIGNVRTGHWKKLRPDLPPQAIAEELQALARE